jgi:hypothetical protein
MSSQESQVSTWVHEYLCGKIHHCGGSITILAMHPIPSGTEKEVSQPFSTIVVLPAIVNLCNLCELVFLLNLYSYLPDFAIVVTH